MQNNQSEKTREYWLFVCASGEERSPLASEITNSIANRYSKDNPILNADFIKGGILYSTKNEQKREFERANRIYVMEKEIEKLILLTNPMIGKKVCCLNISTEDYASQKELKRILEDKITKEIEEFMFFQP